MLEMGRQRHSRRHGEKIMCGCDDRLDAGGAEVRGPAEVSGFGDRKTETRSLPRGGGGRGA